MQPLRVGEFADAMLRLKQKQEAAAKEAAAAAAAAPAPSEDGAIAAAAAAGEPKKISLLGGACGLCGAIRAMPRLCGGIAVGR